MANEIIPYLEMCQRENASLQRGMNYRIGKAYSVILMSQRINAPYRDSLAENGSVLLYEGHDMPKSRVNPNPKIIDQPEKTPNNSLTENGKFYKAAQDYKKGFREPELIRVYEKIHPGIWSYNGVFHLIDSWKESDGTRSVFKFKLLAIGEEHDTASTIPTHQEEIRRIIPTNVKLAVWKRDGGKCTICGATNELHFDHIIPFSKGGTSLSPDNIQLLCARHNLEKRDKIE